LRNDGANDVFIAFDKDVATTDDFKLAVADGLVEIKVQCEKLALVCAAGETASVRVSSNY
jgi:RNA binding exosome subunit